jgi:hypothetical protein
MAYNLRRYIASLFGNSLEAADVGPAAVHSADQESADSTFENPDPNSESVDKSLVKFKPGIRDKPHLRYIQLPASVEKNKWQVELELALVSVAHPLQFCYFRPKVSVRNFGSSRCQVQMVEASSAPCPKGEGAR